MNSIQIKALSDELKNQRRLKYNEYHKRYYHKRVKSKPFVSVLDMENPPPKKVYNRENNANDIETETEDGFDEDTDDNQSVISDCSLIGTTYKKNTDLKRLDTKLREKLLNTGYDTQEKVQKVFNTFFNVNPKYGLPRIEERNENRLEQFYKDTIFNLG